VNEDEVHPHAEVKKQQRENNEAKTETPFVFHRFTSVTLHSSFSTLHSFSEDQSCDALF
jgi:hypothetical protein